MPSSATIPLPKLSFTKKKQRSQVYRMATLDGRMVKREMDVSLGCANNEKAKLAFLVDAENQYLDETGTWVQVVGESSAVPMMTRVPRDMEAQDDIINAIFHETLEDAKHSQFEKLKQNATLEALKWLVGMPTIAFTIWYAISQLHRGG